VLVLTLTTSLYHRDVCICIWLVSQVYRRVLVLSIPFLLVRPKRPCVCAAMSSVGLSPLLFGSYSKDTQAKYIAAVTAFALWCESLAILPRSSRELDIHLSNYMADLWFTGKGKNAATCTFYGLDMFMPGIRHKLPVSLRSIRGFSRLCPSVPHPPLPWTVATAIAAWLAVNRKSNRLAFAVGIVLSFDCYLRTGELLGLLYEDIAVGRDPRLGIPATGDDKCRVHVHLRQTKTGSHKGVEVRDDQVKRLLLMLRKDSKPGERLFPWHRTTHLKWFHQACSALKLSPDYVHHSLRHGGATRDYLAGMPIADVMVRGRWAATKSAVHYIQQGRQLMMLQSVTPLVDELGRYMVDHGTLVEVLLSLSQYT
jgi:integrase